MVKLRFEGRHSFSKVLLPFLNVFLFFCSEKTRAEQEQEFDESEKDLFEGEGRVVGVLWVG